MKVTTYSSHNGRMARVEHGTRRALIVCPPLKRMTGRHWQAVNAYTGASIALPGTFRQAVFAARNWAKKG